MRAFLPSWAFVPALASAIVLPPSTPSVDYGTRHGEVKPHLIEWAPQEAQATFSVPCHRCLGAESDDEDLLFTLQVLPSKHACGFINVTLNDWHLEWEWNDSNPQTHTTPFSRPNPKAHDLLLSWKPSCAYDNLEDVVQNLTVTIERVDGREIEDPHGFTISYKPKPQPELLQLSLITDPNAGEEGAAKASNTPNSHIPSDIPESEGPSEDIKDQRPSIEIHIEELRQLEAQAKEFKRLIKEKKTLIRAEFKQETQALREEIKQCDNIACGLKAIARKAHGAVRVICLRFRPHDDNEMSWPYEHRDGFGPLGHSDQEPSFIGSHHPEGPAGASRPHDPHGHKFPSGPLPFTQAFTTTHPSRSTLHKALALLASAIGLTALIAFIRRRLSSLRRRVERRANREERRRAREYRRCARRQAWRDWWRQCRGQQQHPTDYEEKRALIVSQESILEEAMQDEIRQLREAADVVNSLVQAEEGRAMPPTARMRDEMAAAPLPLSRTNSLPDYTSEAAYSEPPAYEEEGADESDVVVDGFREYTPSTTTVWTPGSSIPDVSPRLSEETMREYYGRD